jgi:conjugative relaxase-like TrwC/TraI family protein
MLSVGIMSSGQAEKYFEADYNYYASEKENNIYQGKLAEMEALDNIEVSKENFIENMPDTKRAGYDLTNSSAKSISIVALTTENTELRDLLLESHKHADKKVMRYAEDNLIYTRVTVNGKQVPIKTSNIMFASFSHYENRELEMHLHTHNFIFNKTLDKNGKIRHIEALPILQNIKNLGKMWRLEQAAYLQERGLQIRITDEKNFFFELKGVPQELIDKYSTRTKQINEMRAELEKAGLENKSLLKNLSNRLTKKAKRHTELADNIAKWQKELKELNIPINDIKLHTDIKPNILSKDKLDAIVDDKLEKLSEFNSSFSEIMLKNELKQSFVEKNIVMSEKELNILISENNNIIKKPNENIYTSREIYNAEQNIFSFAKDNKKHTAILDNNFEKNLQTWESKNFKLEKDQAQALRAICEQKDNILIIAGNAGSGKTTMLQALHDINDVNGNKVIIGLSMEGKAAEGIETAAGIKSQTIDNFLIKKDDTNLKGATIIIDEASKLSTKKLEELTKIARENDCKLVLVGDRKQKSSIKAGGVVVDLQDIETVKTVHINTNVRQKTDDMKYIVNNFASGNTEDAINKLDETNKIIYTEKDKIYNDIVEYYMNSGGYKDTTILANTNKDVNILNDEIHKELINNKIISAQVETINALQSRNLSEYDKKSAKNYQSGDVIVNGKDKMQVLATNANDNKILVKDSAGKNKEIVPDKKYQIYSQQQKEFSSGDKIVFLKNDKQLAVKNGQSAEILSIKNHNIVAKLESGREINVNTSDYNYINHGYCITVPKSQGMSANRGIVLDDGRSDYSTDYVKISRFKNDVRIYTSSSIENIKQRAGIFREQVSFSKKSEIDVFSSKKAKDILSNTLNKQHEQRRIKPLEIKPTIKIEKRQDFGLSR